MMKHFSTGSFVAGVMFGALFAGAWFIGGTPAFIPIQSALSLATSTESAREKSDAISVADQPFGVTVVVESVTVPASSIWVAVRETNGNRLGNILGAARIKSPRSQVTVSLLRATEPDRTYVVQLYRDDGNDIFNPAVNSVYVDFDTGVRVVSYFTTTP